MNKTPGNTLRFFRNLIACLLFLGGSLSFTSPTHASWSMDPTVNVPVCTAQGGQGGYDGASIEIVSDGAQGSIIGWYDITRKNIFAQRIDAEGIPLWRTNGIPVSSSPTIDDDYMSMKAGQFRIVSDGTGGAIFVWGDLRSGDPDIYAQRFNGKGQALWGSGDKAVAKIQGVQSWPELVSDSAGGAFITWRDQRTAPSDSYVQWIGAEGADRWKKNGVNVSNAANHQYYPKIIRDGSGGVIVSWMDDRSHSAFYHWEIYAQRFDSSGRPQWQTDGVRLSAGSGEVFVYPEIVTDGDGGAIITWRRNDSEHGVNFSTPAEVYLQRLSKNGETMWREGGVIVLPEIETDTEEESDSDNAPFDSRNWLHGLVPDYKGGAYFVWFGHFEGTTEYTSGSWYNLLAQHIDASGDKLWGTYGVMVAEQAKLIEQSIAVEDGEGGLLVTWEDWDYTVTPDSRINIFSQKISSDGFVKWSKRGVAVSLAPEKKLKPKIVSDGQGGAIITWEDYRHGFETNPFVKDSEIYSQRVFTTGQLKRAIPMAPLFLLLAKEKGDQ